MTDQGRTQWHCQLQRIPIAIIGMAALFPKARDLQEYWCNIINKEDCITDVPESCWNVADYYDADPQAPDKTYSRRGGFLPTVDFDPLEFGLPPDSLEAIDSAQLLSLIVARNALEDAGYGKSRDFNRETTGVVLGASGLWKMITPLTSRLQYPIWEKVLKSSGLSDRDSHKIIEKIKLAYVPWQENSFPGMLTNVVAGRITNRFDLGGTNCTVDAACASSLSAFKMAVGELIERRCDLMITGGVDTDNSALNYMCFSKTPAFSKKDYLSPFDADSDGMMVGEGIGMMVLKRLDDAERDGDRIYAVVKGVGTSSDGRYKSIYAPRPEGQMLALKRAYEDAGFSPASVGLMEAHGTGTPRGDECEFGALKSVFSEDNPKKEYIALGSVKSQIGHTKAAAGAASLIKTALALHHKILPPTINVSQPNPKFEMEDSPFYLNTEVKPWIQEGSALRRAGVSSFGFGGTNYHVVLEEYDQEHSCAYRLHSVPQAILLWEQTSEALADRCKSVLAELKTPTAESTYRNLVIAYKTAEVPTDAARLGMVVNSQDELKELLEISVRLLAREHQPEHWEHPRGLYYRRQSMTLTGRVVALFPGQGSQYLNMGRKLAIDFPPVHQAYKQMDDLFVLDGQPPLSQVVFPRPAFESSLEVAETESLKSTRNAQPAIGAFSFGLYKILQQAGLQPSFTAGHSFGEISALWAAQVLSDEDYLALIKARGEAMDCPPQSAHPCELGAMLSVQGEVSEIEQVIQNLSHVTIANYNGPNQVVLSGSRPEIAAVQQIFSNRGYEVMSLPVAAAFHSPFIRHASEPFAKVLDAIAFNPPVIPVYANTTGELYPSEPEAIRTLLKEHLLKPVHFQREIENIYAQGGDCFIEIGPRRILTGLVESILGDRPHLAIALNASRQKDSDLQLRQAVVQLQVAGLALKNIDFYQLDPPLPKATAKPRLQIGLNGNNYVSDKTKQAFAEALLDGHQVSLAEPPASHQPATMVPATAAESAPAQGVSSHLVSSDSTSIQPVSILPNSTAEPFEICPFDSKTMPNSTPQPAPDNTLENLLTQFCSHQTEILRVHEQYLRDQADCSQAFLQIVQQLQSGTLPSVASPQSLPIAPQVVPQQLNQAVPREPVHPELSASGMSVPEIPAPEPSVAKAPEPIEPIQFSHPLAPIAPPPVELPTPPSVAPPITPPTMSTNSTEVSGDTAVRDQTSATLLAAVSEKTGYPAEMLELDMDLEADLGIDSIKRVEIMGKVQDTLTDLPRLSTEALGELRTLQQIVDYLVQQLEKKNQPVLSR